MALHERIRPPGAEFERTGDYLERYIKECTPNFTASSLLDLYPQFFREKNIKGLFLDAEGTFVEQAMIFPDQTIIEHIRELKAACDLKIVIITNKRVKDPASFVTLAYWAQQIGADLVVTPLDHGWRKPSPMMPNLAMAHLGLRREQILMAGDKLTGDIRAANSAGMRSLFIDTMVGANDVLGDKIFRRPFEKILASLMHLPQPVSDYFMPSPIKPEVTTEEESRLRETLGEINWWSKEQLPQVTNLPNNLLGFGVPYEIGERRVFGSKFLYDYGDGIANLLGFLRVALAAAGAYAEVKEKQKIAALLKSLASSTDMADGILARRSKKGPTQSGGTIDTRADKIASAITEIGMLSSEDLSTLDFILRVLSDLASEEIKRSLSEDGIDTSAVLPGKLAMVVVDIADVLSPLLRENGSLTADSLNNLATVTKLLRLRENENLMRERHERRLKQIPELERAAAKLMQRV